MLRYISGKRGWVLVDSLLGIVIVATALCALMVAYTQSNKASIESNSNTYATYLAQRTLEDLKQNDGKTTLSFIGNTTVTKGSIKYTIDINEMSVETISNTLLLNNYLIPIQVTVSWNESGRDRSLSMISYYYLN